jgi:hypothetical protein
MTTYLLAGRTRRNVGKVGATTPPPGPLGGDQPPSRVHLILAAIVKPKQRRQLTEENRGRFAATGKAALERYRRSVNLGDDTSELKPLGKP